jgi:uncharacterized protein (DUF983 family)
VPCYRCGARQGDPEPGKPSPWRQGLVREHQVLICPGCHPAAVGELARCPRCDSARLVRRLDQVECLDCRLTRTVLANAGDADPAVPVPVRGDSGLAAEVANALARVLGTQ